MNLLDARRVFADLQVVEVATTRPDGSPHVVPLWFTWRDEAIYVSCRRESVTWRAVERDPRVALTFHVGQAWDELAGAVVYGRADPLAADHPALRGVMSDWFEKYRALLAGEAFRRYARDVETPGILRVRPHRLISWDHAVKARRDAAKRDAR
ncbi:MAG TPA: pyridoxamine 5'-phosphate oxidase family protein [Acidimicrobiales bacterium]|nr:pyridoxamine 5'-phosphate oxidase family protein [Acidimicrobiales bacterium]